MFTCLTRVLFREGEKDDVFLLKYIFPTNTQCILIIFTPPRLTPPCSQLCTLFCFFYHIPLSSAYLSSWVRPPTEVPKAYQGPHPYKTWRSFPQESLTVNPSASYGCSCSSTLEYWLAWSWPGMVQVNTAAVGLQKQGSYHAQRTQIGSVLLDFWVLESSLTSGS